ncbi:hypothetical protein C2857_001218 [Epichloe festucae Fl1]|uniref:DNA binding domain with preference for A/T rich regions-like protein n=1 Tax=Epichloe festucae (strain Fl1) TaxID=877507 RepID=A0A7S9PV39_EPIFF|nr:hypothetical protein C2857_001218 [Epichloe festucae Fl1]
MAPSSTSEDVAVDTVPADSVEQSTGNDDPNTISRSETAAPTPTSNPHLRAGRYELGVLHDAHWRNGIPSKIQHLAESQGANFSVMQIGLTNDGDEAARLTSERTVAAAKSFNQSGYYSKIRKQRVRRANTIAQAQRSSVENGPRNSTHTVVKRTTPLSPPETKFEQARLLTLLRSLNPVVVVDQLCKAAAYFGGIPMAPPPAESGAFPQSDLGNGSGSNFVGWLAEIFPSMIGTNSPLEASNNNPGPPKKRRGRPVGSKSSKVRSDKGKKHITRKPRARAQSTVPAVAVCRNNGEDDDDNVEPGSSAPLSPAAVMNTTSGPEQTPNQPKGIVTAPQSRKRGRPKGSKTRTKKKNVDKNAASTAAEEETAAPGNDVSISGTMDPNNPFHNDELASQEQFTMNGSVEQSTETAPSQPNPTNQLTGNLETSPTSMRKRKHQLSTAGFGDSDQVAGASQTPEVVKRLNASQTVSRRLPSVSSSIDSQTQVSNLSIEGTSNYSSSQLPQFFMTASRQQSHPNLSPNLNQAHLGRSAPEAFTPNDVHMARQNYYLQQQAMQNSSRHLTSMNSSNDNLAQNLVDSDAIIQPSQYRPSIASAGSSAGTQPGTKQVNRNYRHPQPAVQPPNNPHMGSYSTFSHQGFM